MNTMTRERLHRVLRDIDDHLDAAPHGLPVVTIRGGHVYIEPTPDDLTAVLAAFGMSSPVPQLHPIAFGETHVVLPFVSDCVRDGQPWRVWAPVPISLGEYRMMLAASIRAHGALDTPTASHAEHTAPE